MIYLILIFAVLFLILAWRRLDWAVMFLIAALPAYLIRFKIFNLPSTILEVMIWIVFLVWFFKNYRFILKSIKSKIENRKSKINNRYPFDWEIILMLLVALAAAGISGFSASSLGIWKAYFFEPALFFIVVFNVMRGGKGMEKILWALAVSALAVSALAIYQKITGQLIDNPVWAASATRRVVSFFGYPNAVGLYLGPLVLVMMGWLAQKLQITNYKLRIKLENIFLCLIIIVSLLSIYFAKSKGALLGVAVGLAVFGLLSGKKIRLATVAIIILIMIGIISYQPVRQLAADTMQFKTLSGQIRKVGWEESWKMLKDGRLLTGAGLANYQAAVAPYHAEGFFIKNDDPQWLEKIRASAEYRRQMWQPLEIYLYPHNIVLNFWSELGLAGMLFFVWIIIKYFWMGFKGYALRPACRTGRVTGYEYINIGLICAMVVIIIHGVVDVPYFKNDLAVMFWLLVAMISMIKIESINNYN